MVFWCCPQRVISSGAIEYVDAAVPAPSVEEWLLSLLGADGRRSCADMVGFNGCGRAMLP